MRTRVDVATLSRINLALDTLEREVWQTPKIDADQITTESLTSDTSITITIDGRKYKLLAKA